MVMLILAVLQVTYLYVICANMLDNILGIVFYVS